MTRGTDWIGALATPKTYSEILAETREMAGEDGLAVPDTERETDGAERE